MTSTTPRPTELPTEPAASEAPAPTKIKGVRSLEEREVRFQRNIVLFITIVPLLGFAAAVAWAWGTSFHWPDAVAFVVMYTISIMGVTVGYHRMLTHSSFDTKPWVRYAWTGMAMLAIEGGPISWVADHRRHHAFSDKEGDPHSPHLHHDDDHDHSLSGILRGLWHSHVGWMFKTDRTLPERWAADMLKDPGLVRMERMFIPFVFISFLLPAAIGFALTGTLYGAVSAFLWGGLARILVAHHITWSTNSICHFFGKRPFDSDDHSTNNWLLAIVSFGESWHNNHHAFPSSAVHGLGKWQVDISAMVIRSMEKVGLAKNVKTPSAGALERKRRQDEPARGVVR
ncbi:MAG: stearoyl-CoA 9-desaturase [Thermoleophilia bacterium]|nr:stearoyl-CoA 9-desaturase [Thermoleophilia bacterium]